MHPAIKELYKLIQTEDWTTFMPEKNRKILLDEWVEKWIVDVDVEQSVVNPKKLPSESSDLLKTYLAQVLAEQIAEDCTLYNTGTAKISANLTAIRRKAK